MVDYRVYALDKNGKLRDVTFSGEFPSELITAMNVGKTICLYLAKALGKNWVWNENYPKEIVKRVAELVAEAMKAE